MENELAVRETLKPAPMQDNIFFNVEMFGHLQRVAGMLAASSMIPAHFKGKSTSEATANIMIALNLADRMDVDVFMLMQNMYVVHGRPGIEAKLAIAVVNKSGKFSPIQYETGGKGDAMFCVAFAKNLATGEDCRGPRIDIAMSKAEGWHGKTGSKWKTMPELMLMYRAAMFFARLYCPEALL